MTGRAGPIRQVSVRITERCNLRCRTCGQWGDHGYLRNPSSPRPGRAEVGLQRHLEVLQDLSSKGWKPLYYLWGGEPFLYPDLVELIERATRLGLPTSVATNGTGLAGAAGALVKAPLFLAQVSIDGHTEELHNRLRPSAGKGNSFATLQAGLEALNRTRRDSGRRLPRIAALTVISRDNAEHLVDIYRAFRNRVDLFVFYLSWWIDEPRARAHERDFASRFGFQPALPGSWIGDWRALDQELVWSQLNALKSVSRGWSAPAIMVIPPVFSKPGLKSYYLDHGNNLGYDRCVSIYHNAEIGPDGRVSPCRDYHDYVVGNIREASLTELWNSPAYQKFRMSLDRDGLMPVCTRCCGLMGY